MLRIALRLKVVVFLTVNLLIALGLFNVLHATEGDSLWSCTYGGSSGEEANSVIETSDGGFLLAGLTGSFGAGSADMWLVKTNDQGDSLWSHTYGGYTREEAFSVIETSGGNYLLAGVTYSFGSGVADAYLVKLNAQGDSLWSRTLGGYGEESALSVIETNDGGYLLAGYIFPFGSGVSDAWLLKTNAQGDSLWSRTFGGSDEEAALSVIETSDGGFLLAGLTASFGSGAWDMWLVKTNAQGDSLWSRTFGGLDDEVVYSVIETYDGGFLLAGYTQSFGSLTYDMWLVKTNSQGDSLWSRTYGGSNTEIGYSIIETGDGGYLLAGYTSSFGTDSSDMWLVKTNSQGDSLWSRTYGGSAYEWASSVIETSDNNYLLAGKTASFSGSIYSDMWLVCVEGIPPVQITLEPYNPPVTVPASGGSFDFNVALENSDPNPATFDAWIMVQLPNLSWFGPVLGPVNITLLGMTTIDRDRTQNVPDVAPSGTYTYEGQIGFYPDEIWHSDNFTFEKLATGDGTSVTGWTNTGESLEMWLAETNTETPSNFELLSAHPNPFNPSTTISFSLPEASRVNLSVYDVSGRSVTTLIDGWRNAGDHEVIFKASNLSSGIYIYNLSAGDFNASGKMVLMK